MFSPQKLRNFHSLSCPGIPGEDLCESDRAFVTLRSASDDSTDAAQPWTKEGKVTRSGPTIEEADWLHTDGGDVTPGTNGKDSNGPLWAGLCGSRKDAYQLGGELDIEQIERN